nr:LysR family transcriptional regulator [Anaerolineae bacterium]
MIDLLKLQAFLHAAESLNFSEAARQLHISQPTISHHIKALEVGLGVELFDRSGSGLRLTEAGLLLLPRARKLIRQAVELEQMMESLQGQIAGNIRIACSTTTGKYILPKYAARFCNRHPNVRVSIMRCTSEDVVPRLLESEANLGVVSYDVCGKAELKCQTFFEDHIILIVPASHRWAEQAYIDPSELLEERFLIREPSSGTRQVMLAELGKHDIVLDDMNIFMELGNAEAIVKTVEDGFGISFVSHSAAAAALKMGTIIEVRVAGFSLQRHVYMVQKNVREANRAVDAFWGFVHDPSNADILRMAES